LRLSHFIQTHRDAIVDEWTQFARTRLPAAKDMDDEALRDSARELLEAIARDMETNQTQEEQAEKSKGRGPDGSMRGVSAEHAVHRIESGFSLLQLASEYRALRASVIKLWKRSQTSDSVSEHQDDLTRFNEAVDQALIGSLERYTERLDRSRELFLGMLGHDLRNPLSAITTASTLMLRSEKLDEKQYRATARILNSAERMSRMVNDLLDITRTRLGSGIPLSVNELELGAVVRQAVSEIEAAHPEHELQVTMQGDLHGRWDADRMAQVVSNLVANSLQHGAPETPITIHLRGASDEVVLAIHNQGPVIPPMELQRIFEPMVRRPGQGNGTSSSSLGLGLYIVHAVVSAHGGKIHVSSSKLTGTTFTVRLPRHPPHPETVEAESTSLPH